MQTPPAKNAPTTRLRALIVSNIPEAVERSRGEGCLFVLTFHGRDQVERNVWVEVHDDRIEIEFESWHIDDVVARTLGWVAVETFEAAVPLIRRWLCGAPLREVLTTMPTS